MFVTTPDPYPGNGHAYTISMDIYGHAYTISMDVKSTVLLLFNLFLYYCLLQRQSRILEIDMLTISMDIIIYNVSFTIML